MTNLTTGDRASAALIIWSLVILVLGAAGFAAEHWPELAAFARRIRRRYREAGRRRRRSW